MFHSIKGASVVMGFQPVNRLTHHLESLFEQFRSKKRTLDRPVLDLTFRCLDELRDYHRDLRAQGQSEVDLSALTAQVEAASSRDGDAATAEPIPAATPLAPDAGRRRAAAPGPSRRRREFDEPGRIAVTVVFEPDLPLADMKARLVLNRLSSRGRVLATDPPAEKLDEVESAVAVHGLAGGRCDIDELRALADVEGVAEVRDRAVAGRDRGRRRSPVRARSAEPVRPRLVRHDGRDRARATAEPAMPAEPSPRRDRGRAAAAAPRRPSPAGRRRRGSPRRSGSTATGSTT